MPLLLPRRLAYLWLAAVPILLFILYLHPHYLPVPSTIPWKSPSFTHNPTTSPPDEEKEKDAWNAHASSPPNNAAPPSSSSATSDATSILYSPALPCAHLPHASSVLVLLKTGATETHTKLPVHLRTSLRCYPHALIYSDLAETLVVPGTGNGTEAGNGTTVQAHDVLGAPGAVSDALRDEGEEFALWRRMREWQREHGGGVGGLAAEPGAIQDVGEQAWQLDKWKFLPLMGEGLARAGPGIRWVVVVEADTYLVWSNLLRWLGSLDPRRAWYLGGQSWIGDVEFAHGGTGFVLSRPALEQVVDMWRGRRDEWEDVTRADGLGDSVLAQALRAVGVRLYKSWPVLQGETPATLDYTAFHWCFPVVSWHHVDPTWVERLWEFEQAWIEEHPTLPLRHRDVFHHLIRPHLPATPQEGWDNLSNDDEHDGSITSAAACAAACRARPACLQYAFCMVEGGCRLSGVVRWGKPVETNAARAGKKVTSGWLLERVDAWVEEREKEGCGGKGFEGVAGYE